MMLLSLQFGRLEILWGRTIPHPPTWKLLCKALTDTQPPPIITNSMSAMPQLLPDFYQTGNSNNVNYNVSTFSQILDPSLVSAKSAQVLTHNPLICWQNTWINLAGGWLFRYTFFRKCVWKVWRVSVWCLKGVWKESWGCVKGYWKLSGSTWNSI